MEVEHCTVRYYIEQHAKAPFIKWFEGLRDLQAQAKTATRLNRLRNGNFGDCKALDNGIHELRVDYGSGYRIYFGKEKNTLVILLSGGDKRTQKQDIELAKVYWKDYRSRTYAKK